MSSPKALHRHRQVDVQTDVQRAGVALWQLDVEGGSHVRLSDQFLERLVPVRRHCEWYTLLLYVEEVDAVESKQV